MNRTTTFLMISFCFVQFSFGQSVDTVTTTSTASELYGTWYLQYNNQGKYDSLIFTRTCHAPHNWGQRIEINSNGDFVDAYSAKCGNDNAIHHTPGKWTYNAETKYFETTIAIFNRGKKYKVTTLTNESLVLKP
jgi:hypothetical protein